MQLSISLFMASALAIASSFVQADVITSNDYYPLTTIESQQDFCIFLPPQPGLEVAINENNGIPFCSNTSLVKNATQFPEGFITTAHYLKQSNYVQITGFFDRTKYDLGETDGGGQYDNHDNGKPVSAQCLGYNYFVNLIEPDIQRFCIRCCQEKEDCNTGRSGYGCLRVVDGDYTNDNNYIDNSTFSSSISNTHENSVYHELEFLTSHRNADTNDQQQTEDDESSSDPNTDIASEIESLRSSTDSVDELKSQWESFTTQLTSDYPSASEQISELNTLASSLTTAEQWDAFFKLVSNKIIQLPTSAADSEASTTHTDTKEDLEWLFNH
ncbi:hypothetical protein CU098_001207, partial [Rhizopus stolonifer]